MTETTLQVIKFRNKDNGITLAFRSIELDGSWPEHKAYCIGNANVIMRLLPGTVMPVLFYEDVYSYHVDMDGIEQVGFCTVPYTEDLWYMIINGALTWGDLMAIKKGRVTTGLANYEDARCVYGYMTVCSHCLDKVPSHVDIKRVVDGFPLERCEICKKKQVTRVRAKQ